MPVHQRISLRQASCLAWCFVAALSVGADGVAAETPRSVFSPPHERSAEFGPQAAGGSDTTGPRIDRLTPAAGSWVVNNIGLTQVEIGFDENVQVPADAVRVWTVAGGPVTEFESAYDGQNRLVTITFDAPIKDAMVTLVVDYTIHDGDGNALDGEIADPLSPVLPSGDGIRGGLAVLRINVLQGDVTRDGVVDEADGDRLVAAIGRCVGQDGFDPDADLNDDGCINVLDVSIFAVAEGRLLQQPGGDTPAVLSTEPPSGATLVGNLAALTCTFDQPLDAARFHERGVYVVGMGGVLHVPTTGSLDASGLAAKFTFSPAIPRCGTFQFQISNALADGSGALTTPPNPAPVVSGLSGAPAAPALNAYSAMTNQGTLALGGSAVGSTQVEVFGSTGTQLVAVTSGMFTANVALEPNEVNYIYVTGLNLCGTRSSVTTATVTHDGQSPALFIDFPPDGVDLTTATIDVAGRVGDVLSGFMGLTVTVNGITAAVDVGIGTNGTFLAQDVPLIEGVGTLIEATATDQLGNARVRQITVFRNSIVPGVPYMTIQAGNSQTGPIHGSLANPIVARVFHGDDTPFAKKLVTFEVTRSDGRLSADGLTPGALTLQVLTDVNGDALAHWQLGGDAGCGNNRVQATSKGIAGTVFYCATATPGPAAQINIGTGDNQRVEAGSVAPQPLRAWVSDGCNGVASMPVTFTVLQGGGLVNGQSSAQIMTSATGHAEVEFTLGPQAGNHAVAADFPGNLHPPATFVLTGLIRDVTQPTRFSGIVLDGGDRPIEGAACTLIVEGTGYFTTTDALGQFEFASLPAAGPADLLVHGAVATAAGGEPVLPGTFPYLHFEPVLIANAANSLPGPILLPELNPNNARIYDGTFDVELTVEGMEGLRMTVFAGTTVLLSDGTKIGPGSPGQVILSLNQVHHDDIPMPIPDGAAPPFAWTLQPGGAVFDTPIQIEYPNMSGLPAGAIAYFLTFNHDTMRFEIFGSGHVVADGSAIVTDAGVGITTAGWGCNCPPYSVTGEAECCSEPAIIEATEWLVVHDPEFEKDHCQPGSTPRCKQAELMMNEAKVKVKKAMCDGMIEPHDIKVWLKEVDTFDNDEITLGAATDMGDTIEFRFRTTVGGSGGGAKTDSDGRIYVEGALLDEGPTSGPGTTYQFELWVDDDKKDTQSVTIKPLIKNPRYTPNILDTTPKTVDPYTHLFDIETSVDAFQEDGYGTGEGFGLLIKYEVNDELQYPPDFKFLNDPAVGSWGGDAGISGMYTLGFNESEDSNLWTSGFFAKTIKWEGFTNQGTVVDPGGNKERASKVFMGGMEAELDQPFTMGDGVAQSKRGVGARWVVKEGNYVNEFDVKRKADAMQRQRIQSPFEVKYEFQ